MKKDYNFYLKCDVWLLEDVIDGLVVKFLEVITSDILD